MKQQEHIGFESINQLRPILSSLGARRIFLVTGKDSYDTCGAAEQLNRILSGCEIERFCDFRSSPKLEDTVRGIEAFRRNRWDAIVAVGGGSVIDMAKLINFFACNDIEPLVYFKQKGFRGRRDKPLVAVPTTAGSGSETTQFAVVYFGNEKRSVDDVAVLPDAAIVDPSLTMSLPRYITACTGMDALAQAVESYWSIWSNEESRAYAKASIELCRDNLEKAVNGPDASSRLAMAKAAHLSGKAINITRTTAPHAISYPLTSYFGIPHGHAVGLTLAPMLEYISGVCRNDVTDMRGYECVRKTTDEIAAMLGAKDVPKAAEKIQKLMETIELQTKLSPLSVKSEMDIETIVDNCLKHGRTKNNPRKVTREGLKEILLKIY
jgi:alcohol dehydrogenase class IV